MCDLFHSYKYIKLCIIFIVLVIVIKHINFECIILTLQKYWLISATSVRF